MQHQRFRYSVNYTFERRRSPPLALAKPLVEKASLAINPDNLKFWMNKLALPKNPEI